MNTKHTIAAIAISLLGATAAFAADTPAQPAPAQQAPAKQADSKPVLLASASTTAGASTAAAAAVTSVASKPAGRTRAEVRAEAEEAVRNHRSTMSQQYDLLK
jgi:hypothetical protein